MQRLFDRVGWASRRLGHAVTLAGIGWDVRIKSKTHIRFRCVRGVGRISMRIPGHVLIKLPLGVPVPVAKAVRSAEGWRAVDPCEVLRHEAITRQMRAATLVHLEIRDSYAEMTIEDHEDWRVTTARLRSAMRACDAIAYQAFGKGAFAFGLALAPHEAFGVIEGHPVRLRFGRSGADLFVHARGRDFEALDPGKDAARIQSALDALDARIAPDGVHTQTPPISAAELVERVEALVGIADGIDGCVAAGARKAS